MKKLYPSISRTLLVAATLFSCALSAQQYDKPHNAVTPAVTQQTTFTIGDDGAQHAYNPGNGNTQGGGCDSILSTLAMGNGNDGVMFDVVANTDITVTFLDALMNGTTDTVFIYQRNGTHVGHELSMSGWTLVGSAVMTLTTQDSLYRIPVFINQGVLSGDTMAYYVTGSGTISVDYTNGTLVGAVAAQDPGMKILEGTGMAYPFAGTYTPRIYNGVVNYCVAGFEPCLATTTTYAGGNGWDGNMFDVYSADDITINGFSANINGTGPMMIYYHSGTYAGTETTPGAWTLLDSAQVTSSAANVPTVIPFTGQLTIPAGSTYAFYITGNTTQTSVNYTNGVSVGNVCMTDGIINIMEGQGGAYPFTVGATPRIWNGTIDYCVGITGIEEQQNSSTVSSTVYPNPVNGTSTLHINGTQPMQNAQVVITDVTGRVVETRENVSGTETTISNATLTSGIYFYSVYQNGQLLTNGKFAVE